VRFRREEPADVQGFDPDRLQERDILSLGLSAKRTLLGIV
jgi:hypothetical protein